MVIAWLVIVIIAIDLLYLILDSVIGGPAWSGKGGGMGDVGQRQTANSVVQEQAIKSGDSDVRTSGIVIILSILFPIVGIILGCIYIQSYNETRQHAGKTYLKTALITVGVVIVIYLISIFMTLSIYNIF